MPKMAESGMSVVVILASANSLANWWPYQNIKQKD